MNRKDSKRKSRLDLQNQTLSGNGVFITVKGRPRQNRRRMTCPSPAEINKAMVAVTLAPLGRGCSLEELLGKCIQSFDLEGKLWRNEDTVHMTLVMHSWVVPSAKFAQTLLQLYKDTSQNNTKIAICHFARFWVTQYPEMFRLDSKLEESMSVFWEVVKESKVKCHRRPVATSCINLESDITRRLQDSPCFNKKRKVSLLFDHLDPSELADHLSYLDFKFFCRISHLDYRSYTLHNSLHDIPRLETSVTLCNSISQWVQIMILNRPTPQQRAEVFTKFIHVTQKLRKLQNFNTLMAVIGGLCHSAISRLKDTHTFLSQDVLKTLSEMTELLSSSSNYSTYRRVYTECGGFKIPILGVQLKDLVSLNEALPDYLDNGKINVSKLHSVYQHILELRQLQKTQPPFSADKEVILLLTSSLDVFHTEDEIYSLSYTREPRSHRVLHAGPFKPSSEITQWTPTVPLHPTPETLSHNVAQIVESVFQFYDPEQRGFVSMEDFEKTVASLPFSCHVLDKERDGQVSRQDMTSYFMKASHVCSRLGVSFLQSLVEARLQKSPLCASCIWALAKQGLEKNSIHNRTAEQTNPTGIPPETSSPPNCQNPTQQEPAAPLPEASEPRKPPAGESVRTSQAMSIQMQELETERERLLLENTALHAANSQLCAENARLQSQLYVLKDDVSKLSLDTVTQPVIEHILETMNALHLQTDTAL
ncbi:RAS guanyl-releasing protein 4 [Pelodytes ibericus]